MEVGDHVQHRDISCAFYGEVVDMLGDFLAVVVWTVYPGSEDDDGPYRELTFTSNLMKTGRG